MMARVFSGTVTQNATERVYGPRAEGSAVYVRGCVRENEIVCVSE